MWQFEQACLGMAEACRQLETPIVSGNVSFYNETGKDAIYPTPKVAMVGVLEDISKQTTQFFKDEGDTIILFGENTEELGGSEYLKLIHNKVGGMPPHLNYDREKNLHKAVLAGIGRGVIRSAHDISDGGLAIALAECCIRDNGKIIGVIIETGGGIRNDALLFGEAASRMIVSCKEKDTELLLTIAKSFNCPAKKIGRTGGNQFIMNNLINITIDEVYKIWSSALPSIVNGVQ